MNTNTFEYRVVAAGTRYVVRSARQLGEDQLRRIVSHYLANHAILAQDTTQPTVITVPFDDPVAWP